MLRRWQVAPFWTFHQVSVYTSLYFIQYMYVDVETQNCERDMFAKDLYI